MQSDTRWVCKHRTVKVFVSRFRRILATLHNLGVSGSPRERAEAKGLVDVSDPFPAELHADTLTV